MLQFSQFVWALRSSVFVVFNNFLLIDATDRSKISRDQKRFFIALSPYPLSFFANTPFKFMNLKSYLWKPFRHTLIPAKSKIWFTWVTHIADINNKIGKMFQETYYSPHNGIFKETKSVISIVTLHAMMTMPESKAHYLLEAMESIKSEKNNCIFHI